MTDSSISPCFSWFWPRRRAEVLRRHFARAVGPGDLRGRVKGDHDGDGVGTWRRIAEVATKGGPTLYLGTAYQRRNVNDARVDVVHRGVGVDLVARHRCPHRQPRSGVVAQLVQLRDALAVHQKVQLETATSQLDQNISASSKDTCPLPMLCEQVQRLPQ